VRVAINALFYEPDRSAGTETYLRELVRALAGEYPSLRISVLTTGAGERSLRADGFGDIAALRALPAEEYRRLRRQFAEQLLVQVHARREGADLLHSLASTGPVRTPGLRSVVTLHDVTFMHTPTFGRVTTWGMTQVVRRAARDADSLIAVSRAARDEICATLGIDPARFTVVPHGVGEIPRAEPVPEAALREHLALGDGPLVLCVAAVRPHKNQELLVRALPQLPADATVVLAGRHEDYAERLRQLARGLGVVERVRLTGYLADAELERLWKLADCAAFPTRAEGFGLPVLEAMARGVPVATSGRASLAEVAGDAALLFDPERPDAIRAAIERLLSDPGEATRLRRAGLERVRTFTWERTAELTAQSYARALAA
jgi:glycosyltransferase involved in cell wall biosynthesis